MGVASVLVNNGASFVETSLSAFSDPDCVQGPFLPLSSPHSTAFVDLNGDCLADLFLTVVDPLGTLFFQVWLNGKNQKYCLVYHEQAPDGAGQVSFADVDRNGMDDLVFPVGEDQIFVIFNDNSQSVNCKFRPESFEHFRLPDLNGLDSTDNKTIVTLSANYSLSKGEPDFPATLQLADMDLDGFPDLLAPLYDVEAQHTAMVFFANRERDSRRTFVSSGQTEYHKVRELNSLGGAFFDLNENSIMDILVTILTENKTLAVASFYNNLVADTFHLKAIMADGDNFYGCFPGAVFTFDVTDLDMNQINRRCSQQPLTAWFALQPPYCLAGTGRTVSYIENFNAAVPFAKHSSRMWTPIIPNSDLIVLPTRDNTDDWRLELFANPSDSLLYVIASNLVVLAVLGAFIIWRLHKEKQRDARSKFS